MSEDEAKAFLKKAGEDKELQEKLMGADSDEKFFAVVKEAGFDFTKEEWGAVASTMMSAGDDLTDEALEQASGGALPAWCVAVAKAAIGSSNVTMEQLVKSGHLGGTTMLVVGSKSN
jgi:predicted ribosomally synthesized peptide with nif11-like leader